MVRSIISKENIILPAGQRAFIFLSADYGNIGDIAISSAQKKYLFRELQGFTIIGGGNMGYISCMRLKNSRARMRLRFFKRDEIIQTLFRCKFTITHSLEDLEI